MKARGWIAALAMSAIALGTSTPPISAQSAPDEAALEKAIHNYILKNPKVIKEALEKAELQEQIDQTKRVLKENSTELYRAGSLTIGAENAKVSIVEFFDYNCPFCRKVHPKLKEFLAKHPDTQIVLKDIATFGKNSEETAKLVIASKAQGKARELHEALMSMKGVANEASTLELAKKLGLDVERLKKDAAATAASKQVTDARQLADTLGVGGTPLFLIGHNGIPGAPDDLIAQIEKFVGEVRASGCDVC